MPEAGSTIYWLIGGIVLAAAVIFIFSKAFPSFGNNIKDMMNGLLGSGKTATDATNEAITNTTKSSAASGSSH